MRWLKPRDDAADLEPNLDLMKPLRSQAALDDALGAPVVLLFKHSTACWLSQQAKRQVEQFAADRPEIPICVVDVLVDRPVAQEIERRFEIRHESPQVILLRDGQPVWNASHRAVTAADVTSAVEETAQPG
jgi:bacillithiol system protein YtxJ